MGNQLAGIAPSQIFPVEHYLTDLPEYQFETNLGSTRFFKVAKAKFREGSMVVKVFAIHDPSLPLRAYKQQLEVCKNRLVHASNCLAFKKSVSTEKAELLFRQYVKDNLYDRISTRPFLNNVEKKWIAFQILCAISQCHKVGICHGDIKLENIMVTSWNWVMLTDFASFKPTYLPEDNPADFSYFFDTSRRRTCYIAPERFVKTLNPEYADNPSSGQMVVLPNDEFRKGDLVPSMDIFSAGCALSELFTEGHAPFDFSQLLSYRNGEYNPSKIIAKIEDVHMKEMIEHMIQKDPAKRFSADGYLEMQRGKAFPDYFYSFMYKYLQGYSVPPIVSPEEKIARLKIDVKSILGIFDAAESLGTETNLVDRKNYDGLVVVVSLVTSCLRAIKHCSGKLQVLEILQELAFCLSDELILDRLVPYMLHLVNDPYPHVRMTALEVLTRCLMIVKTVPKSDANIFPEYLLPQLAAKAQDESVMVRVEFAKNIAALAETAIRFLEASQIENPNFETNEESHIHYQANYDSELQVLHEMIQQCVSTLLTDGDNIVKRTLLEFGITRLCVFFGRRKANDVVLSHMITVLNDKEDRHLRGAFFDTIVGVAAYIGWQCSPILKPLLQQGLSDGEEFVTSKALNAMSCLAELGLFQKHILYDLVTESVPFLCHPNKWIRNDSVGFICTAARCLNTADIHCKLLPLLEPFLKHPIIQIENELILLDSLRDPIPRSIFETIFRTNLIGLLLDALREKQSSPGYIPPRLETDVPLKALYRRLLSDGMSDSAVVKILAMKDYLLKLHKAKSRHESRMQANSEFDGKVDLGRLTFPSSMRHQLDLGNNDRKFDNGTHPLKNAGRRKQAADSPNMITGMNEEWQHMFGSTEVRSQSPAHQDQPIPFYPTASSEVESSVSTSASGDFTAHVALEAIRAGPAAATATGSDKISLQREPASVYHGLFSDCKRELDDLIQLKKEQYCSSLMAKECVEGDDWDTKQPPASWRPKGTLVAHLHEHKQAVNRVLAIPNSSFFATCSNDGTVKIWDCGRMEQRSICNRSRQTYSRPESQLISLEVCQNLQSLACASDRGVIHVFRIEASNTRMTNTYSRLLDPQEEGCVVDMHYFDTGSQSVLTYGTMYGSLVGWDLRAPGTAWKLDNDPKHGLLTSYCVDRRQCWLGVGTSNGTHLCWDLRFRLPISTVVHPEGARIRRMALHPIQQSWVVSAVQGNNEVSMWDMETEARPLTLWASPAPTFSQVHATNDSTLCFYLMARDGAPAIITAGSDARIRYWDVTNCINSYVIAGPANDGANPGVSGYRTQVIDGTEVHKELYKEPSKRPTANPEDLPRRGPDAPPVGHLDAITDIAVFHTTQWMLVSTSRDGVVKVWK